MIIRTNQGLGDCIYLRPVLKQLPHEGMILETPWPQVFMDIPKIKYAKPGGLLRTQRNNVMRGWEWQPNQQPDIVMGAYDLRQNTIIAHYCRMLLGHQPNWLDNSYALPIVDWAARAKRLINIRNKQLKPVCLIRPNTLRGEWMCPARNPKTQYLQRFIDTYKNKFFFISLADLQDGQEVYDGKLKGVDWEITVSFPIETVMGMFFLSDIIITSPSFWVAMGLMLQTNMVVIYGAHEPHYTINDKRCDSKFCTVVEPKPFNICDREITDAYKNIDSKVLDAAFTEGVGRCLV